MDETAERRMQATYQHDPSIVSRQIAGEMILVPIRKNLGDLDNIYTLNETGARIWELIDGQRSNTEIVQQLAAEFNVDPATAEQDFLELVDSLIENGAILEV